MGFEILAKCLVDSGANVLVMVGSIEADQVVEMLFRGPREQLPVSVLQLES